MCSLKTTIISAGKILSIFTSIFFITNYAVAQKNLLILSGNLHNDVSINLIHPSLVNKLYQLTQNKLIWFLPGEQSQLLRQVFKNKIDSSINLGLQKNKYHSNELKQNADKNFSLEDSLAAMQMDRIFTDAAIAYCKDVYQGVDIDRWMSYDEISKKYEEADNTYLVNNLITVRSADDLLHFLNSLEPNDKEYLLLKTELQSKSSLTFLQKQQLTISLNLYRWIHHFHFEKYIVVNIPSASLRYYEYDSAKLSMKVVVGKPSTKTPRFAAYSNQVILYPYWNVPASIAMKELLPRFKRNPRQVNELNIQLIDSKGRIVDPGKLNWRNYNKAYFPFRMRQSTGCDNSLGMIKFDLTSPYSVYLHDTNNKSVFLSSSRYYSHGCIRVEKPVELANYLLQKKIDSKFLEACLKEQVPIPVNLVKPVPIFVVYQTVDTDINNGIKYYKDVTRPEKSLHL